MIIAMIAPQTSPQTPNLIFPAFSGFIDNTSLNYAVFACDDLAAYELNELAIAWVQVPFLKEHWRFNALFVFVKYSKYMPEL